MDQTAWTPATFGRINPGRNIKPNYISAAKHYGPPVFSNVRGLQTKAASLKSFIKDLNMLFL